MNAVISWTERLRRKLEDDTARIQSAQVIATALVNTNQVKNMGKLSGLAQRLTAEKAANTKFGDKLAASLDDLANLRSEVEKKTQSFLESEMAEVRAVDSEMRQLSNIAQAVDDAVNKTA